MAISEHDRFELHRALEQALGVDQAATLMEHLPPVGWADVATKRDLDGLRTATRGDIDALRGEMRSEFALVRAELRAELHETITAQTRNLVFALIGSEFTMAAIAFGAARLGR